MRRRIGFRFICFAALSCFVLTGAILADEPQVVCKGYGRTLALTELLAKEYVARHPEVKIAVAKAAFQGGTWCLADGSCTLAVVPRVATEDEIHRVRFTRSQELVAFPIAKDALVVLVTPDNPIESLTIERIAQIFTNGINEWPQLDVTIPRLEEGFYPKIHRPMPEEHTGGPTVLKMRAFPKRGYTRAKQHFNTSEAVARKVTDDVLSLGIAHMNYPHKVKVVPVKRDEDSPPILPTPQTVSSGEYPLSHHVYWCFVGQPTGIVKDLLAFAVSAEGQEIVRQSKLGFVALPLREKDDPQESGNQPSP